MMPLAVVDRGGGDEGGVGIAHAKGGLVAHQCHTEVLGGAVYVSIHQALACSPLASSAGSRGFHPQRDGEVIADREWNLKVATPIELRGLSTQLAGHESDVAGHRSVMAV